MTDVSYSNGRERARKKVADLIWEAFGDAGHTQAAIAKAAAKLTKMSDRQMINYMQRKADPPLHVADALEAYVVAKTERLARRLGGEP
ncbi:hypothetical protein [uncultured Sphingomonas sp.]|uniref:hypothetical protein n=1 Tax=uncultured Sphingomonas sp. TaxID=158754 RepID=UPI0025F0548E|nr:hypothetical protein [uncultured Sphingomonas sp.]